MVQLSGLPSLFASSSKPGFSSRLPVGGTVTVKLLALVAVPPGVVTLIDPVVAPLGTLVVIWVSVTPLKAAAVPLKVTAVAPLKWLPLIVTVVPTGPLVGLKELIVGGGAVTVMLPPRGVVALLAAAFVSAGV